MRDSFRLIAVAISLSYCQMTLHCGAQAVCEARFCDSLMRFATSVPSGGETDSDCNAIFEWLLRGTPGPLVSHSGEL